MLNWNSKKEKNFKSENGLKPEELAPMKELDRPTTFLLRASLRFPQRGGHIVNTKAKFLVRVKFSFLTSAKVAIVSGTSSWSLSSIAVAPINTKFCSMSSYTYKINTEPLHQVLNLDSWKDTNSLSSKGQEIKQKI